MTYVALLVSLYILGPINFGVTLLLNFAVGGQPRCLFHGLYTFPRE